MFDSGPSTTQRISAVFVLAYAVALVASVHAQQPPPPLEGRTAEQAYKNIQVMKGTNATEVILSMHVIRGALGVDCDYCHEMPDRDSDAKKPKRTARDMMRMVIDINKNMFQGRQVVTCWTCHRGSTQPIGVEPLPVEEHAENASAAPLPPVDQILAKYVQALGGEQAIRKVTSRVITATQYIPTGPGGTVPVPAQSEQYQKAPNLVVNVYRTPTYTVSEGFDGTTKWTQDPMGRVAEAFKIDQLRARRISNFYESLDLKKEFTKMEVAGLERVRDHDAYVVVGYPQDEMPERLYFDRDTGLLLRRAGSLPTPVGPSPFHVDFADYRDAGNGVKQPFVVEMTPATPRTELAVTATVRIQKIQENVAIDEAKFRKPASKPAP